MYITNKILSGISLLFTVYVNSVHCYNNNQTYVQDDEIIISEAERDNYIYQRESSLYKRDSSGTNKYDVFKPLLKVYDAGVELIRMGSNNDGGYFIPVKAMEAADVMLGYGIDKDISFEREFSQRYNKASYGFDCGVKSIATGHEKCYFLSECIGTSNFLYGNQESSGNIFSFDEQLERLRLTDKKIVLKMDIEGAEYHVLEDVLEHYKNITGIVIEVHLTRSSITGSYQLLSKLNENFLLLHIHGNNCCRCKPNEIPSVIELTYINKNLVDTYTLSSNHRFPLPIDQKNCKNIPDCSFEV